MANAINWFEIPAKDFGRAKKFYETILDVELAVMDPSRQMGMFPANWQKGEIGGAVCAGEGYEPGNAGTTPYLNGGADLGQVLNRVEAAGGRVVLPKTKIPMGDAGYMALFIDTEGNKIGLHSMG